MTCSCMGSCSVDAMAGFKEDGFIYAYPEGYEPKGVDDQAAILRELFPELRNATHHENIAARPFPAGAEGWFAIPRWEKLGLTYGEAVDRVFAAIASSRGFYSYYEGQTGPEYLRQQAKAADAFRTIGDRQNGHDILVVPCQFGLRHRGRSVRQAREAMRADEFGLGAFAVGCMILTHPEREVHWKQLHVDCAGDEFASDANGVFSHVLFFHFSSDRVRLHACRHDKVIESYGSASAFLPE